jgi:hypothetical protein
MIETFLLLAVAGLIILPICAGLLAQWGFYRWMGFTNRVFRNDPVFRGRRGRRR